MARVDTLAATIATAYPTMASYAKEIVHTSDRLGIDPGWLANVINTESSGYPNARNPTSDASGLIQFMPFRAAELGTTTAAIRAMSGVQQMPLVEAYFRGIIRERGPLKSQEDVIAAVFYPANIGQPLKTFPLAVQQANHGLANMRDYTLWLAKKSRLPIEGIDKEDVTDALGVVGWTAISVLSAAAVVGTIYYVRKRAMG